MTKRTRLYLLISVIALVVGCGEEPEPTQKQSASTCCDCLCTDGADVCLSIETTVEVGSSCDMVCENKCAEQSDECTIVETAAVCFSEPPAPQCATSEAGPDDQAPEPCP